MSAVDSTAVEMRAARIREHMSAAVMHVLGVGQELIAAKAELAHGEFGALLDEVGMSRATASRMMRVAENPVLSNVAHGQHLPASWRTLAELARLEPEQLKDAIDSGDVTPTMTRNHAAALVTRETHKQQHAERSGLFAPAPYTGPMHGPEQPPEPAVAAVERLVRHIVGAKAGLILNAENSLDRMLDLTIELAGHVGVTRDEVEEYATEHHEEIHADEEHELDVLLEFADRIGYRIGEGFEGIVVDRHDPHIEAMGGAGTLPDDILASAAWVYLNVRFHHLGLSELAVGAR